MRPSIPKHHTQVLFLQILIISIKINNDTEINDLKKARALLKSVILSNP